MQKKHAEQAHQGIHRLRLESENSKRISMFFTEEHIETLKEEAKKANVSYSALIRSISRAFLEMSEEERQVVHDEISNGIFGGPASAFTLTLAPKTSAKKKQKIAA